MSGTNNCTGNSVWFNRTIIITSPNTNTNTSTNYSVGFGNTIISTVGIYRSSFTIKIVGVDSARTYNYADFVTITTVG
jgi:hypothetical protein